MGDKIDKTDKSETTNAIREGAAAGKSVSAETGAGAGAQSKPSALHKTRKVLKVAEKKRDELVRDLQHEADIVAHGDPKVEREIEEYGQSYEEAHKEARERWYKRLLSTPEADKKLPIGVKILGVLILIGSAYELFEMGEAVWTAINMFRSGGMDALGVSTIVVTWVRLIDLVLLAVAFGVIGVQLLRGKRTYAALIIYAIYVLIIVGGLCSLMLFGIDPRLIVYGVSLVILVAFQVYLDPHLREERQLQRMLRDNEVKHEQEAGILGRDLTGKGYIKLDFFNLFWIFFICSILGDFIESIFHVAIVDPGHWQDRAGLLFGPFSPIYGCGAVLMTLFLNRTYKSNPLLIFFASALIGGLFEAFVSFFMQYAFGAVAWDYSGQFLSLFDGRTCGLAMLAWGILGLGWIKLLLPGMLWLIDRIPWQWRYSVTTVATLLMAADCIMSLQALDCWYERLANDPINTPIKDFYAHYFDNAWMENRFQSMTIHPDSAVRSS